MKASVHDPFNASNAAHVSGNLNEKSPLYLIMIVGDLIVLQFQLNREAQVPETRHHEVIYPLEVRTGVGRNLRIERSSAVQHKEVASNKPYFQSFYPVTQHCRGYLVAEGEFRQPRIGGTVNVVRTNSAGSSTSHNLVVLLRGNSLAVHKSTAKITRYTRCFRNAKCIHNRLRIRNNNAANTCREQEPKRNTIPLQRVAPSDVELRTCITCIDVVIMIGHYDVIRGVNV